MKFEPGNTFGSKGRPPGVRNRLFARVFEDTLNHWNEPVPGRNISKGMAALEAMYKMKPADYVKAVLSLLPREFVMADPTVADLDIEQVDALLHRLKQEVLDDAESKLN
jgi:hypothetical protein